MNGQHKPLSSLFDGLLESAVTCLTCRKPSLTRDRYMDLSLDIVSSNIQTLPDALEEFCATETLVGDNKVHCRHCQGKRNATKGLRLATAPSILVIHLKRFAFDAYGRLVRLSKLVDFDERLEIGDYMSRVNKARPPPYELVAVLVHQGRSCESGHYIAFTRHDGDWYKCNDSVVEQVPVETVLKQQAYILVYEVADMRRKHGYASPSGGCSSRNKTCGGDNASHAADPKSDFMKLLSSSLCGTLDDLVLQDFCWDVSNGVCHNDDKHKSSASAPAATTSSQRRRRRRDESAASTTQQQHYYPYRSSDISVDPHDDLSTLGESTVDTADTSKVPFRRSCSSGNLKSLERARDKISHSTGRPSQRFFTTASAESTTSHAAEALPDYKTAKRWAQARKAAAVASPRLSKAGATPRRLPPRPKAPSRSQRRAMSQEEELEEDESDIDGTADEATTVTRGLYDD